MIEARIIGGQHVHRCRWGTIPYVGNRGGLVIAWVTKENLICVFSDVMVSAS